MAQFAQDSDSRSQPSDVPAPAGPGQNHSPLPRIGPFQLEPTGHFSEPSDNTPGNSPATRGDLELLPTTIGPYEIVAKLGEGGMGVVYKARHILLKNVVALKTLKGSPGEVSGEHAARFLQEAKAVAQLRHQNLVPMKDFGEQDGQPYFTMEFTAGGTLANHLNRFKDPRKAAAVVEKIARGVHCAHENGIWHRDLKPSNVLIDEHDEPMVSDFGLAKFRDGDAGITQPNQCPGTRPYMAPEQFSGQNDKIGNATDVWALGVILFELLTGKRPFSAANWDEAYHHIRNSDPPRLCSVEPSLDRDLEAICLTCLQKNPKQRYATAKALAEDLGNWLHGDHVKARPPKQLTSLVRAIRKHPTSSVAAGLLLGFAAISALIAVLWKGDHKEPSYQIAEEQEPNQQIAEEFQRATADGKPVQLLGDTGLPPYYRRRVGDVKLPKAYGDTRPLLLETWDPALVELLPDPNRESFRFRAELRSQAISEFGEAGIYFSYQLRPARQGLEHWFWALTINEMEKVQQLRLAAFRYRENKGPDQPGIFSIKMGFDHRLPQGLPAHSPNFPWRKLALEVKPDQVAIYWEGELLGKITAFSMNERTEFLRILDPTVQAPVKGFSPHLALGLFWVHPNRAYGGLEKGGHGLHS